METKILKAVFGGGTSTVTNKRTRTDYGQVLEIIGIDLPDTFECIFSNSNTSAGVGKKMIGSAQRVLIPDEYLTTGQTIYAWILLHDTEDDGRHMYSIRIPVADMPDTSPEEPTPVEQSIISQAITALNSAVTTTTQKAQEATESADRAEQAAEGTEGYTERAESAQQAAESARDIALEAKVSAQASAATASEKASEAISSATTASQSAITAENASESARASATASAESASQASQSADTAGNKATEASGYASSANTSEQTASQKASEAAQSASTAVQAKTDAESAKTASQTARGLAETARNDAVSAKTDAESARDEAQEIVDGISGKVEQIDSNTERIESLEDDRYKPYAVDSASGSIASFSDGADGIPLKSCIVRVEPVQEGSGDPSPDNVRPISGWDSVSVWDDPVYSGTIKWNQLLSENQAAESYSKFGLTFAKISGKMGFKVTGTFTFEGGDRDRNAYIYRQKHPISIIKDHVYCIAYNSEYANVYCYGAQFSGNWIGYGPHGGSIIKATNSEDLNLSLFFGTNITNGTVFNEEILVNLFDLTEMFGKEKADEVYTIDMQYPRGQGVTWFRSLFPDNYYEQDTDYTETCVSAVNGDPYQQVEITFPAEAGTVYGGYIDPINGELVVDRAQIASYNGETLPSTWISDRDVYADGATPTIGAQVVYKLAEPIHYPLTAIDIKTLLGQNNLWANTGDVSVEYRADVKLYINKKIAEALASLT